MKARTLFLILAAGLMVAAAAPAANAACGVAKTFTQWDSVNGCYAYITTTGLNVTLDPNPAAPTGGMIGRLWQAGSRTLANEGTGCPINAWLNNDSANSYHIDGALTGQTGTGIFCDPVGCATGNQIILVQGTTTDGHGSAFAVGQAAENVACGGSPNVAFNWDYTSGGFWTLTPIPNPTVAITGKAGTVLNLNVGFPSVADADHGPITGSLSGLRLMRAFGTADPGRAATAWTFTNTTVTTPGTIALPFDCATAPAGQDVFFALQASFDGGAFNGDYVGASTQVRCNSTLANPNKFKNIDKGKGHGK